MQLRFGSAFTVFEEKEIDGSNLPTTYLFKTFRERWSSASSEQGVVGSVASEFLLRSKKEAKDKTKYKKSLIDCEEALKDLKLAFSEYYLTLVLLQSYQNLNFIDMRLWYLDGNIIVIWGAFHVQ